MILNCLFRKYFFVVVGSGGMETKLSITIRKNQCRLKMGVGNVLSNWYESFKGKHGNWIPLINTEEAG